MPANKQSQCDKFEAVINEWLNIPPPPVYDPSIEEGTVKDLAERLFDVIIEPENLSPGDTSEMEQ